MTIYESVYEGENATENSKTMQVDGEEQSLTIRFRELPYSVETGEAEMIGVDTVARTARNAAADTQGTASLTKQSAGKEPSKDQTEVLSPEEEERKHPTTPIPKAKVHH